MDSEFEWARVKHEKNLEILFSNEGLVLTVLQALTGGAMFAALAASDKVVDIIGPVPFLVFLTTMDVALVLLILTAYWKHEYKKWDVKATISSFAHKDAEFAERLALTGKFLTRMRRGMACAVWIAAIGFAEIPVFAWLAVICPRLLGAE